MYVGHFLAQRQNVVSPQSRSILICLSALSLYIMLIAGNDNIGTCVANSRRISLTPREKVQIVEHVIEWMEEISLSRRQDN